MGLKGHNQHTGYPSFAELFWSKVDKNGANGCWLWTGARLPKGYGIVAIHRPKPTTAKAHRVAYELLVGPIPAGLVIDHLCRVPSCVNPSHLEPVTNRENLLRGNGKSMVAHRLNRCGNGHSLADAYVDGLGRRRCRDCSRDYQRARRTLDTIGVAPLSSEVTK